MGRKGKLRKGYTLITRLVGHINQLLNIDLDLLYEKYVPLFKKSLPIGTEFTHEQFAAFQKFQKVINESLESFIKRQGYQSTDQVFSIIEKACVLDRKKHREFLDKLMEKVQNFQNELSAQTDKTSDETKKGDEHDVEGSAKVLPKIVYAPSTLESLVNSILNVSEYETFARIMRAKVEQLKALEKINKRMKSAKEDRNKRERVFKKLAKRMSMETLSAQFAQFKERMLDLLPSFGQTQGQKHPFYTVFDKNIDVNIFETALVENRPAELLRCCTLSFHYLGTVSGFCLQSEVSQSFQEIRKEFPPKYVQEMFKQRSEIETKSSAFQLDEKEEDFDMDSVALRMVETLHLLLDKIDDSLFEQVKRQEQQRKEACQKGVEIFACGETDNENSDVESDSSFEEELRNITEGKR